MGKYTQDAAKLLELVGGKENIAAVSHCITRMRFVLNDPALANIEAIEAIPSVKGSFTQAGQFQVIIGNTVADFYNDFVAISGIEGVSKDEAKSAAKQNQNALQRIMTALAEIFAPLIPAIITGGLILGFRNVIDSLYIFEGGTATLVQLSQFWAGVDHFLWLIGEAVFHMLPVGICWSITKKMGTNQMLGIVLGLTLVSGQLLNAYAVNANAVIPQWDFGFVKVDMIGYQAQVIPAMLAGFTLVYLEKFFRKVTPAVISMIVVPFCSLLLAVMAAHFVLGPIGWTIGSWISSFVYAGITGSLRLLFGAVFGFFYAPLVITGLHHMSNAIDTQLCADFGGTMLWPMIALSNIAQGSAVLGNDGQGIGLFRSEFLYLSASDYPTEDEQFEAYRSVAAAMNGKRVVIRTLDIGADKQVDYFDMKEEENPALGVRAIRICLNRPEVFRTQLRALYRASVYGKIAIMFPMITSVWEVKECKRACVSVMKELEAEGIPYNKDTELGIMIETPSSVFVAEELAKLVDFFSVGTNDLTQYTLACDRQANDLGKFYDPHHPALLRAIKMAADAAHKAGIWIGICGELGADISMMPTFLAMGIDELSVSPSAVLPVRAAIRQSIAQTCTLEMLEC